MDNENQPYFTLDKIVGHVVDAFAAIGFVATIAFFVGYFWAAPL